MNADNRIWHPEQMDLILDADAVYRTVAGPKLFFITPFFTGMAAKLQQKVEYEGRNYRIGGIHPFPRPGVPLPCALDIRHCRALFVLLSFRGEGGNAGREISFSMYAFAQRYASSNGGAYHRRLRQLLGDLADTWIEIKEISTGKVLQARLLEKMDVCQTPIRRRDAPEAVSGQMNFRIQAATLSDWFLEMLARIAELLYLRLDVFTSIRSPIAQSLYMFIPSRAIGHPEQKPWEVNLSTVLSQIGYDPVPEPRSKRIQLLQQNKNSVLAQLNGLPISKGILRAALRIPEDRERDAFLQVWQELPKESEWTVNKNSKIYQTWIQNGGTPDEYRRRMQRQRPIDSHEADLLRDIGVDLAKDQVFLRQVRALVGADQFTSRLAETKGSAKEPGFHVRKDLNSLLGGRLMEAVRLAAQSSSACKTIL
jgi:hypothetical protein